MIWDVTSSSVNRSRYRTLAAMPIFIRSVAREGDERTRHRVNVAGRNEDAFDPVTHDLSAAGHCGCYDRPSAGGGPVRGA